MDEEKKEVAVEPVVEVTIDPLAEKDAEIKRLREERDNYRTVALARKGKLPADSELLGEDFDEYVKARVQETLADKEINRIVIDKEMQYQKTLRENAELKLLVKNRPGSGLGSDSGTSSEVKDNVFSTQQLETLKQRAIRLKVDPEKFIENTKKNILNNSK